MAEEKTMSFDEALYAEYSKPAEEVAQENQQPPVQNLPPTPPGETSGPPSAGEEWRGNPLYYQSGKKAGQLRPKPRISVAYEPDPNDSTIGGDLVTGAMFLTVIDILIPGLIVTVNNWIVKNPQDTITFKEMQLESSTMKRLETLADSSLRRIKLKGDPAVWFLISMTSCYAFQFAKIKFERKLEEAQKAKEKKE